MKTDSKNINKKNTDFKKQKTKKKTKKFHFLRFILILLLVIVLAFVAYFVYGTFKNGGGKQRFSSNCNGTN